MSLFPQRLRDLFSAAVQSRLSFLLTILTLVGGLALTSWITALTADHYLTEAQLRFDRLADRLTSEVQRRMNLPIYGLKGARGVYAASKSVERAEFSAYVASRNLPAEFPSVIDMHNDRRPDTYAPFTRAVVPKKPVPANKAHLAR